MTLVDILHDLTLVVGSGGLTALGLALIKRGENRDTATTKATAALGREDTSRHKIDDGALARSEAVLERTLIATQAELTERTEQLVAERIAHQRTQAEHTRTQVAHAECQRDITHLRAIATWCVERIRHLDPGGPMPPLFAPETEPAE
jgi:hypothetical protein